MLELRERGNRMMESTRTGGTKWVVVPAVEAAAADPWRALRQIVNALGPDRAGCAEGCGGCAAEMAEALRIARDALRIGVASAGGLVDV